MAFCPTDEQKNALSATGTVLVSAAAGSGKTAVLVERVVGHIIDRDNPVDADRLLVVTFTNAAAAEMRARISKRLLDEARNDPENTRLRRQQILLSKASISTIDSFCINLLREHFYELNLSPDFKVAESGVLAQIESNAIEKVINRYFEEKNPDFLNLAMLLGADDADKNLRDTVLNIYSYLRSLPFPQNYIKKVNEMYTGFDKDNSIWLDTVFEYADEYINREVNNLKLSINELEKDADLYLAYGESFKNTLSSLNNLYNTVHTKMWDKCYDLCNTFTAFRVKPIRGYEKDEFKADMLAAKKKAEAVFEDVALLFCAPLQDVIDDIKKVAPAVKVLFDIVMDFWDESSKEKQNKNCLDFADIEYLVLQLLVKEQNGEITLTSTAKELSDRFYEVLVDEYQDTNDLQNTIFNALSDNGKRLFMVGDVKQSVYRFRQANPANFLKYRETFPMYKKGLAKSKVIMSGNFRSAADICDFVNFTFQRIMSKQVGEMNYTSDEELNAKADFPESTESRVQLHLIEQENTDTNKSILEARHIANYIKSVMAEGEVISGKDGMRDARYSDFAILLRGSGDRLIHYVNELRNANIPVWADVSGGFLQSREIIVIISLLRVIDNPMRDVPLLSLMLSELYGFTPDELAEMRINKRRGSLYSALLLMKEKSEKVKRLLSTVQQYREWAASMPVDMLIRRIYDDTGFLSIVELSEDSAQKKANLLLLLEYTKSYEDGGLRGLSRFLAYIERMESNESALKQASVVTEADDVVRIMTIHRSKGLQFPVCILAGLSTDFNKIDIRGTMQLNEKLGVGLKIYDSSRNIRYSTLPRDAISIDNERLMLSEELRILYVAMTRAQERLTMVISEKNIKKKLRKIDNQLSSGGLNSTIQIDPMFILKAASYAEWILAAALLHPNGGALRGIAESKLSAHTAKGDLAVRIINTDELLEIETEEDLPIPALPNPLLVKEITDRLDYEYPFTEINKIAAKQTASQMAHSPAADYAGSRRPVFLEDEGLSAAQRGTALHKFMEHGDYYSAKININNELENLVEKGILTQLESDAIDKARLKKFFESSIYNRMAKSQKLLREQRFMIEIAATELDESLGSRFENEMVVIQGIADCVFVEDEQLVIVDYKTDRVENADELRERYKIQLKVYERALASTLSMPVKSLEIYSFHLNEVISL